MSASGYYQGAVMSAISGIEIALWDLAGKIAGLPVYRLLGGKYRDRIEVYATAHNKTAVNPEAYAARARELESLGFSGMKISIHPRSSERDAYNHSLGRRDMDTLVSLVRSTRDALSGESRLAVDAHGAYSPAAVTALARAIEDLEIRWLEDPVPAQNLEAMKTVAGATQIPICTGENLYSRFEFRELIMSQVSPILSPDFTKTGGLTEGRRIADLADMYYLNLAPHNIATPIGTMAATHLCAAVPNFEALEVHFVDDPLWHDVVEEGPILVDGHIAVPEIPGIGVTPNIPAIRDQAQENLGFLEM